MTLLKLRKIKHLVLFCDVRHCCTINQNTSIGGWKYWSSYFSDIFLYYHTSVSFDSYKQPFLPKFKHGAGCFDFNSLDEKGWNSSTDTGIVYNACG